jgi:predicted DNA-binding transcriptional regulator AlpA
MTAHGDRTLQLAGEPAFGGESLLTAKDVARILNVPLKRVYELGIPAVRLSARSLRWRLSDVQHWIEGRIRS